MKKVIAHHYTKYRTFILYAIIGVSGVLLDFITFLLLFNVFGIDKIVANIIGYCLGTANNFVWNARYNFKTNDRVLMRFLSFFGIGILGLCVSSFILWLGVDVLNQNANIVKFITIFVIILLQYNLNKLISFKK